MNTHGPISQLRSAVIAALVALLVWVFAEGESISSRSVVATVNFPTEPTGDIIIRPIDPNFHGSAQLRLEGTTRTLDAAALFLSSKVRLIPGTPGVPNTPGRGTVDLRLAISNIPEFQGQGSTVAEAKPEQILVEVVQLVSREMAVRPEFASDVAIEGEAHCTPAMVTIRVPKGDEGRIAAGAVATAVVGEIDLRRMRGDGAQSLPGVVRAPEGLAGVEPLFIYPEQVTIALRLKRKVDSLKIPTVPVWFSLPPTEDAGKWVVELQDKFITDVTLTGPVDELQKIRSGEISVKAMIELSTEDLEKGVTSKPALFPGLPPGVSATANLVRLAKITKRAAPKPTP